MADKTDTYCLMDQFLWGEEVNLETIRIVCLANSRKLGERCIAGVDLETGKWVRPVNEGGAELSLKDINYEDGSTPQVLDIINMPVIKRQPLYYQPENWVINRKNFWSKVGRLPVSKLQQYCENLPFIFYNSSDRLPQDFILSKGIEQSLILVEVEGICIEKKLPPWRANSQVRATFKYNGIFYDLAVTDIQWEQKFSGQQIEIGEYPCKGRFLLTIGLGKEFKGEHYKLIVSIIKLD
jgi:hypothetical protein